MKEKTKLLTIVIFILILIVSLLFVFWHSKLKRSNFMLEEVQAKITEAKEYGDKVVGWLRVEGTNIDLPLIEVDEDTNLNRNDYDFAWTNSFPDQNKNRPAFVSHNIRNVSRNPVVGDKSMRRFEQLMSFIYPDFIRKYQYIQYTDEQGTSALYRIYAVALLEDDQKASFMDTYTVKEQQAYLKKSKKESLYNIKTDVSAKDSLLTLFTCTRFYGNSTSYSFRVDARKLRKGEQQTLAKVKTTNNYQPIQERMGEGEENAEI